MERLTLIELVVLGLVAERPRHGYDVEAAIEGRRLRYWTPISFSSIYHVLNKLSRRGLLRDRSRRSNGLTRRVYRATAPGMLRLREYLRTSLRTPSRSGHEVELALMFAHLLGPGELVACLKERAARAGENLAEEKRLRRKYQKETHLVWTDMIFRHTIAYMAAERAWIDAVLAEMKKRSDKPLGGPR